MEQRCCGIRIQAQMFKLDGLKEAVKGLAQMNNMMKVEFK